MRVLLVEDDERVGAAVTDVLRMHGFAVERARTVAAALRALTPAIDVVVLDLGLPDGDGFDLCAEIRRGGDLPIVITTARGQLTDRVHGLHLGADDYLVKPYDVRELMARIHAVTRRAGRPVPLPEQWPAGGREPGAGPGAGPRSGGGAGAAAGAEPGAEAVVSARGVTIDLGRRTVVVQSRAVALTRKEFDLLAALARDPGIVVRRERLVAEVWAMRWAGAQRSLEVHVASIRAKTGVSGLIETVRGVGYRLGVD